jgi:catechol 2,3-dioxygenase-like lactoylglutathione lyase family enzyme
MQGFQLLLLRTVMAKEVDMAKAKHAVPEGFHTVTPQLTLDNAAQAIDWYKKALGAEEVSRAVGPDGKIMHAELRIGDSRIMVNDAMMGSKGPKAIGGSPASLWIFSTAPSPRARRFPAPWGRWRISSGAIAQELSATRRGTGGPSRRTKKISRARNCNSARRSS